MDQPLLVVAVTSVALLVSSVAGYGGSLVLVPSLAALLGPREGIALAALLLGWNNVFKAIAYRRTLALREGWPLVALSAAGVWLGTNVLLGVPERATAWLIVVGVVAALVVELVGIERWTLLRKRASLPAMAASGVLSGVSGSSGPLKGVSIRALGLPRLEHVGLAACVSLVSDLLKVELFASAGLLGRDDLTALMLTAPVMPVAAWLGRAVNRRIDEATFRWVFWTVVGGYSLRMLGAWF